ncbi:MAG: hypothetical protein ACXU8O_02560 [Asticcacaulis sp.]
MSVTTLFWSFWWLIFPLGGMFMGLVGMIGHYSHRREALRIIKSYADQGKEPPAALLEALKSDEERAYAYDHGYYGRRRWRRYRGWGGFSSFVVFAALAAGFGYAHYNGLGSPVFGALALAFGVASFFTFVGAVISMMTRPKYPQDKDEA